MSFHLGYESHRLLPKENNNTTYGYISFFGIPSGLSLRAGDRGFSLAATSLSPNYFHLIQNENIGKNKMHQIAKL